MENYFEVEIQHMIDNGDTLDEAIMKLRRRHGMGQIKELQILNAINHINFDCKERGECYHD